MGCPDSVIHLAWKDGFVHNSNAHMDNLSSHYKFLRNLVDAGCKNISVMGTMHEIGFYEGKLMKILHAIHCPSMELQKCIATGTSYLYKR